MARYQNTVEDAYSRPLIGATVYVRPLGSEALVTTLTDDSGATLTNPLPETDGSGVFHFNTADGYYELEVHVGGVKVDHYPVAVGIAAVDQPVFLPAPISGADEGKILAIIQGVVTPVAADAGSIASEAVAVHTDKLATDANAAAAAAAAVSASSAATTAIAHSQYVVEITAQQAASAVFGEVVEIDIAHCFTDAGCTSVCTAVGQAVAGVKDVAGNIILTQSTAGSRPTLQIDSRSGKYCLQFDGTDDFMFRTYKGDIGTLRIEYALDFANRRTRPNYQVALSYPSPASGGNVQGYDLYFVNTAPYQADVVTFQRHRSDGTTSQPLIPLVVGHADSLMMVSSGTTTTLYRSGQKCVDSVSTATGAPSTLNTSLNATLGCRSYSDSTRDSFFKGRIFSYATAPTAIDLGELAGLAQWGINRIAQRQMFTGWLGVFFQGDASGSERGASHAPVMKHLNAALTKGEYRPSNAPVTTDPTNHDDGGFGDYGLATNGTDYFLLHDKWNNSDPLPLFKFDGFNWTLLTSITTGSRGIGPPSFARNVDNIIYTDGSGCAYIFFNSGNMYYIKSADSTWASGGAWGLPTAVPGFTGTKNYIDATVMRDAAGLWHMAFATYETGDGATGGGQIRHASCPAGLPTQTWTLDASNDFYGFGSGYEGPQFVNLGTAGSPSFAILLDRDGCGYSIASLTALNGTAGALVSIQSDDIMEHGEVAPLLPGYPNPCLQTRNLPRPYVWPGKGLLKSGDIGNFGTRASGLWDFNNFTGGTSPGTWSISNHNAVADPNGDLTASTLSYSGGGTGSYNLAACDLVETVGATASGMASRHTYEVWMKGHAGGEVITLGIEDATFTHSVTTTVTLTTSWARYEVSLNVAPYGAATALLGVTAGAGATALDVCWPSFK